MIDGLVKFLTHYQETPRYGYHDSGGKHDDDDGYKDNDDDDDDVYEHDHDYHSQASVSYYDRKLSKTRVERMHQLAPPPEVEIFKSRHTPPEIENYKKHYLGEDFENLDLERRGKLLKISTLGKRYLRDTPTYENLDFRNRVGAFPFLTWT